MALSRRRVAECARSRSTPTAFWPSGGAAASPGQQQRVLSARGPRTLPTEGLLPVALPVARSYRHPQTYLRGGAQVQQLAGKVRMLVVSEQSHSADHEAE